MGLTNKGLVEYCEKVLNLGNNTIYVYGIFGQELTQSLINFKAKQVQITGFHLMPHSLSINH